MLTPQKKLETGVISTYSKYFVDVADRKAAYSDNLLAYRPFEMFDPRRIASVSRDEFIEKLKCIPWIKGETHDAYISELESYKRAADLASALSSGDGERVDSYAVVEFWRSNRVALPKLAKLAFQVLLVIPSSAGVERLVFSVLEAVVNDVSQANAKADFRIAAAKSRFDSEIDIAQYLKNQKIVIEFRTFTKRRALARCFERRCSRRIPAWAVAFVGNRVGF